MTSPSRKPGDVDVSRFVVYGRNWMDLTQAFIDASIYESVLAPAIVAEFRIRDDKDLASILPLVGEETIEVEFATPDGPTAAYRFHVNSMEEVRDSVSQRDRIYVLRCVSPEYINNITRFVQKSYNAEISRIVEDLVRNGLSSEKGLYLEKTRGVQKIIVQNERPFHAIDRVRRRATSVGHLSSTFLFYETQAGYAFCTIEDLVEKGRAVIGDKFFTYDPLGGSSVMNRNFRNVIACDAPQRFQADTRLLGGMTGVELNTFDVRTLQYTSNAVSIDPRRYAYPSEEQAGPSTPEFLQTYRRVPGRRANVLVDSTLPPTGIPDVVADQHALASIMGQNAIRLHVFGDAALKAGDVIEFNAPTIQDVTGTRSADRLLSGNYMITRMRHIIRNGTAAPQYTCALECFKGGFQESP